MTPGDLARVADIRARADAAPSIVPGLVERIQWACKQIEAALDDSRVDGAAAAWLRTIKDGLDNGSGEMDEIRAASKEI